MPNKNQEKESKGEMKHVKPTACVTLNTTTPSLPMPQDEKSQSGSSLGCEPYITIDDLLHQAEELFNGLRKLSQYKYPLAVRRGVRKGVMTQMNDDKQSKQIKASGRTYFLDIEKTTNGSRYLRITESRKRKGDTFERNSVNVFPEDAAAFAEAVSEMTSKLR